METLKVAVTPGAGLDIHKKAIVERVYPHPGRDAVLWRADGLADRLWRDADGDGGHRSVLEAGGECSGVE